MHTCLGRGLIFTLVGVWATGLHAQTESSAYELSTYLVRMPVACGDEVGRSEPYVVVKRLDPELEDQIDILERRIKVVVGSKSMRKSESTLDDLAERERNSRAAPLSEDEKSRLASLRDAKEAHEAARPRRKDTIELPDVTIELPELPAEFRDDANEFSDDDELEALESRVSLSEAEKRTLDQGQELMDEWSRLESQLWVTSRPNNPKSIVVYPNDDIEVVIWESDFFADDRCFSTIVTLDRDTLDKGFVDVEQTAAVGGRAVRRELLLLRFSPVQ